MSQSVPAGERATFQCSSCTDLLWKVNGSLLNDLSLTHGDIVTSMTTTDGNTKYMLSIFARPFYNGTWIECAFILGSDYLPPVQLLVESCGGTCTCTCISQ